MLNSSVMSKNEVVMKMEYLTKILLNWVTVQGFYDFGKF